LVSCLKSENDTPAGQADHGLDFNPLDAMRPRAPLHIPAEERNGGRVKANDIAPAGVYVPNYNLLTPHMRSPEYVQISTAAAITLGVMGGKMYRCSCTRCLNLLLTYPEGCRANCAYCGLARHREAERDYADRNFIRVDWPAVPMDQIIDIVAADGENTPFHRMCISMITHPNSDEDAIAVLRKWTDRITPETVPVSILSNPTTMARSDVQQMHDLGADIFTVALDAVTPEIFDRTRGRGVQSMHRWRKYWEILHDARDIFGSDKFGAHIIIGMGETEHQALSLVQRLTDLGGQSHMFCFFPEKGSLMDHLPATPRDQWRRVQLGRYLIHFCGQRVDNMSFDDLGRVTTSLSTPGSPFAPRAARVSSVMMYRPVTGHTEIRRPATSPVTHSSPRNGIFKKSAGNSARGKPYRRIWRTAATDGFA
jgi:biotin synthase